MPDLLLCFQKIMADHDLVYKVALPERFHKNVSKSTVYLLCLIRRMLADSKISLYIKEIDSLPYALAWHMLVIPCRINLFGCDMLLFSVPFRRALSHGANCAI